METAPLTGMEDGSCWAEMPDLPGCLASGDTLEEMLVSLREGTALYLDAAQDAPIPGLQGRVTAAKSSCLRGR